jgi:hypothetical protein
LIRLAALLCIALFANEALALTPATRWWISVRGGAHFFTDGDHDDLERLSFVLSNPRNDFPIEFEEKGWELPFGVRLGRQFGPAFSAFALYERMPYLLDAERAILDGSDITDPRPDTVRLRAPANLIGGGVDLALFSGTYGGAIRVGGVGGYLKMDGHDEDYLGYANYRIEADGFFLGLYGSVEYEFSDDLTFYPFAELRFTKLGDPRVRTNDPDPVPDFDVDYNGLTLGIELRLRAWPLPGSQADD